MSNHTPEPWNGKRIGIAVHYFESIDAEITFTGKSDEAMANARRIVACVNACRGLGTDELEQHGLVSAVGYELIELTKQRGELLRDMQDVLDMLINQPHAVTAANQAEDMLRLSIGTAKYFAKAGSENHSPDIAKMVVPEGWQLVPVEPTEAMISEVIDAGSFDEDDVTYFWDSMLAAAPKPEGGAA